MIHIFNPSATWEMLCRKFIEKVINSHCWLTKGERNGETTKVSEQIDRKKVMKEAYFLSVGGICVPAYTHNIGLGPGSGVHCKQNMKGTMF